MISKKIIILFCILTLSISLLSGCAQTAQKETSSIVSSVESKFEGSKPSSNVSIPEDNSTLSSEGSLIEGNSSMLESSLEVENSEKTKS